MIINDKLKALGVIIPKATDIVTIASYCPYRISGNLVYISGQLPRDVVKSNMNFENATICTGIAESEEDIESGQYAAKMCAIQLLYVLQNAIKDLQNVKSIIKLDVFVASGSKFYSHHKIANGASDFITNVFGQDIGQHVRVAIGVPSLPLNAMVEISGIFEFNKL